MTLPSVIIKDKLVADGYTFGGTGQWALYIGKQPTNPVRVATIYDSVGLAPNPKWLLDYPGVQIRVRGGPNDYAVSGDKARELRNRLLGVPSYDHSSGDRVVSITMIGDVTFMGWEESTVNPEWVFNLSMIVEPNPLTAPTNREPL